MEKEFDIMWRKVKVTINDETIKDDTWIIAKQKVYVELWTRAGRGKNRENNIVGNGGSFILNGDRKINVYWSIIGKSDMKDETKM